LPPAETRMEVARKILRGPAGRPSAAHLRLRERRANQGTARRRRRARCLARRG
jgi:hypothetical protein